MTVLNRKKAELGKLDKNMLFLELTDTNGKTYKAYYPHRATADFNNQASINRLNKWRLQFLNRRFGSDNPDKRAHVRFRWVLFFHLILLTQTLGVKN